MSVRQWSKPVPNLGLSGGTAVHDKMRNMTKHESAKILLLLAIALPPTIAYSLTPSATLFNQLAAVGGWGLVLLVMGTSVLRWTISSASLALALLTVMPWVHGLVCDEPLATLLDSGLMLAAALLILVAAQGVFGELRSRWFTAFSCALVIAGLLAVAVSLTQVFMPAWADGTFISRSGIVGRAVGNMRQPNHLASLLMWSCVGAVYLCENAASNGRGWLVALLFAFIFAVVLSASRTGIIGVLVLAIWGGLDRRLSRSGRIVLLSTPVMFALSWALMWGWAHAGGHAFGAESRLAEGAGSPSRLAILANAWELVKRNPWTGVGWGQFNLAWTMTPFPGRPVAFFDHTHNIAMQWLVEFGIPAALLVLGLLSWALWRAFRASSLAVGGEGRLRRCAFMLVLMIGLHSLLEYPLWYS